MKPTRSEMEAAAADRTTAELFDDIEMIERAIEDAAEQGIGGGRRLTDAWNVAMAELTARGNMIGYEPKETE